jgi:hypothetical protein
MIAFVDSPRMSQTNSWQAGFLKILPRIERYARRALCSLRGDAKDDAMCEVVANCVCAYRRLFQRNEIERAFASTLVRYAVALYYRGRRAGPAQRSRDVYSARTRKKAGIELHSLGTPREQRAEWMECLTDNRRTPVPDQAHFRVEFPRWLSTQTRRDRRITERLSLGYTTKEVADKFKLSPGRVSQIRRELSDSWHQFCGEKLPAVDRRHRADVLQLSNCLSQTA